MRWIDLIALPCGALWRQKARTLLTTLGVLFGSFVLAASLSIGQGVQDTIDRLLSETDFLRRVNVLAGSKSHEDEIPTTLVSGEMNAARRQRLEAYLQQQDGRSNRGGEEVRLTSQRIEQISQLPHVEAFVPEVSSSGVVSLEGGPAEECSIEAIQPHEREIGELLIAGRAFERNDEQSAIVSEFLLYRMGIRDDAALQSVLGKKIKFTSRQLPRRSNIMSLASIAGGAGVGRGQAEAMEKVARQLPRIWEQLDLTVEDKAALASLAISPVMGESAGRSIELEIVGIIKVQESQGFRPRGNPFQAEREFLVPPDAGLKFAFQSEVLATNGLDRGVLVMNHHDDVRAAVEEVEKLDLNAWAPLDFIERQRMMHRIVFGSMSLIAAVALFVAAMGIANTMLMSVIERTREIGVMKSIGASDGNLQLLFLVEGLLIGLTGGVLGLLLAWAASIPGDEWVRSFASANIRFQLKERLFVFPLWINASVIGFAVLMTTLGAYYPARRAAGVDPVRALRHE